DYDKINSLYDKKRAKDNKNFTIIITGVGIINAAHGLTVYLESWIKNHKNSNLEQIESSSKQIKREFQQIEKKRDLIIIQTGIAGFFKGSGLKIGDIAVAASDTYIHTGVGINTAGFGCSDSLKDGDLKRSASERNLSYCYPLNPLPFELVPNCPTSKNGHFVFDKTMIQKLCSIIETGIKQKLKEREETEASSQESKKNNCRVMTGDFITVSTITATPEHADRIFRAFNCPCMESMEGAASAHIAALYNISFLEVRAGSNPVGIRNKEQWNIPLACQRASFAVKSIIENGDLFIESSHDSHNSNKTLNRRGTS
ncbi:MAG: hypothetical protein HQK73_02415, partial [Desulfamplus sp.]|nr:hypothetical protein [Desulfamplus sp.]